MTVEHNPYEPPRPPEAAAPRPSTIRIVAAALCLAMSLVLLVAFVLGLFTGLDSAARNAGFWFLQGGRLLSAVAVTLLGYGILRYRDRLAVFGGMAFVLLMFLTSALIMLDFGS